MCGRYAATKKPDQLVEEFEVDKVVESDGLGPDYNVAPTKKVYAVLDRTVDETQQRQLRVVHWGLVPSWAKDVSIGARMINARAESLGEKPAFRRAFVKRRCLLPADGYYEWYRPDEGAKARKQPFFIHSADGSSLAMAGLYEIWRDPEVADDDDPEAFRWTVTVVTTDANADTARIHDRMPVLVSRDDWQTWLDPATPTDEVSGLLHPAPLGLLGAYPVSTLVNRPANNGPELLEPLPNEPDEPEALF